MTQAYSRYNPASGENCKDNNVAPERVLGLNRKETHGLSVNFMSRKKIREQTC
jgi:hypothetical protein